MRVLFVVVLVTLVVYVAGENCFNTEQCIRNQITTCSGTNHVECSDHHCECMSGAATGSGAACTRVEDCHCRNNFRRHCIDGRCHCNSFGFGGQNQN